MQDLDFFLSLERQVWQALVEGDTARDGEMLAPDFLGVYPSGFSDRAGHMAQLDRGPSVAHYALSRARLLPLGPGRVLITYLARFARPHDTRPEAQPEAMYVSSIWEQRGQGWLNVFSQDSPVDDRATI